MQKQTHHLEASREMRAYPFVRQLVRYILALAQKKVYYERLLNITITGYKRYRIRIVLH